MSTNTWLIIFGVSVVVFLWCLRRQEQPEKQREELVEELEEQFGKVFREVLHALESEPLPQHLEETWQEIKQTDAWRELQKREAPRSPRDVLDTFIAATSLIVAMISLLTAIISVIVSQHV